MGEVRCDGAVERGERARTTPRARNWEGQGSFRQRLQLDNGSWEGCFVSEQARDGPC